MNANKRESKPSTNAQRTLIGIPTYNEIENLPRLVEALEAIVPEADILVVDDNSEDGTGKWADERAKSDGRISCLHREGKLGSGSAILASMREAIARGYACLVVIDCDFSHDPTDVPALIAGMEEADVAIGSVWCPGASTANWPLWRNLLSRAANVYTRIMLGLRVADCSNAFRCYRVSTLKKVDFDAVRSQGFSFQEEILWRLVRVGARVKEVPTVFAERVAGASKVSWREVWNAIRIIGGLGIRHRFMRGS